jgi:hypothetical protein
VKQVGREPGVRYVAERFRRHAGNADVVRQELEREKGVRLSLRTVEREVRHLRCELPVAEVRFAGDSPLEGDGFEPSVPRGRNYDSPDCPV